METAFYRKFWAGVLWKAGFLTVLSNMIMAVFDKDDEEAKGMIQRFLRNYRKAWEVGNLNWLGTDITPIYRMFGGSGERRRYFSILGHFKDPIKFILKPLVSAKHKGSVLFKMFFEALTGTDWRGRRFTTYKELIGADKEKGYYKTTRKGKYKAGDPKFGKLKGQTVVWDYKKRGGTITYDQIPSYIISQAEGATPVQVQNLISWITGEMAGFEAGGRSLGLRVSVGYEKKNKKSDKSDQRKIEEEIRKKRKKK